MKIVCISDTHNRHLRIPPLPEGDVIVHAGDMCSLGNIEELEATTEWLKSLKYEYKIVIAGNHDWPLAKHPLEAQTLLAEAGCIYLQDSSVMIEGKLFYGSPWTPMFFNWAFMEEPGEIRERWRKIPAEVDVLITHGPPRGVLDPGIRQPHAGDLDLMEEFLERRINPKLHIFGHLHEGHGVKDTSILMTTFVNAAMVDNAYRPVYQPILMEL